ncbi:hypothetical protein X753_31720 [Mesorhizobium sp. LNJC399B00]|nr:hypothetical protein X753_31720 [Mesorhizobium sp. LNJC399B00]
MRRFIGVSTTKGAVSPWQRSPAMKVCVFQCPNGAFERSRWPFRQRPRKRVIFVVVPVSSMNTPMFLKPHPRLAFGPPLLPRLADVGTILLAGQQRFFEAIAVPDEPARDRGRSDLDACSSGRFGGKLRHGDVILRGHAAKQERTMRVELGMAATTAGLGRQALGLSIVPHQDHDERNRHPKMCRRRMP